MTQKKLLKTKHGQSTDSNGKVKKRERRLSLIKLLFPRIHCIDQDDFLAFMLVKLLRSLKSYLSFENSVRKISIEDCLCYCYNIWTRSGCYTYKFLQFKRWISAIQLIILCPADKYLGNQLRYSVYSNLPCEQCYPAFERPLEQELRNGYFYSHAEIKYFATGIATETLNGYPA